jgi:hypothetical protein
MLGYIGILLSFNLIGVFEMPKVSEMSSVELFSKFYTQSLTAGQHVQNALLGSCFNVVVSLANGDDPQTALSQVQACVTFMEKKDPNNKLVQTNSILSWYTDIAGMRISNVGKSEPSIVRLKHEPKFYDREYADSLRNADSWMIHGRKKQEPKPASNPHDQIVRSLAVWVAMGGAELSDLEVGMPAVIGDIKKLLKSPEFNDKIEERKAKLDERGMEYVKA